MSYLPRRANHRLGLNVPCEVREGCEPWTKVILTDLSRTGFRMAWQARFREDDKIWVRIPGLAPLSAVVRWRNNTGLGCEFSSPLYEPVFEHFARIADESVKRSA